MNEPGLLLDDEPTPSEALSAGYIALIVIAVLVAVLGVGLCAMFVIRMRRRSNSGGVNVPNTAYAANAASGAGGTITSASAPVATANGTLGSFACAQCGKTYQYAEDLAEHAQLRHSP